MILMMILKFQYIIIQMKSKQLDKNIQIYLFIITIITEIVIDISIFSKKVKENF
jgi:hypothetical protein